MLMSIEWHLLAAFITTLGLAFPPLLWVAAGMFATPVVLAGVAAWQAPMPRHPHPLSRLLIAYLHFRQPIARGWARYSVRLKAKVMKHEAKGFRRQQALPFDPNEKRTLCYWSTWHEAKDRLVLLDAIKEEVRQAGWRMRLDSGWEGWDMEIYGSRYVKVRLTTATEQHHGSGYLTRVKVQLLMSRFCQVLMVAALMLSGLLLMHLWPFSRPAVLIPLSWWAMYLVNKARVSRPVLGLIDHAAEMAGFYPIHPKPAESRKPADVESTPQPVAAGHLNPPDDVDEEETTPSVA
jgi:hypothetical protein